MSIYEQKGVDMRIGVDIISMALKKQVQQIILISGDSDFVPAAKQARREGKEERKSSPEQNRSPENEPSHTKNRQNIIYIYNKI